MRRVVLSPQEKRDVFRVFAVWDRERLRRSVLEELSAGFGVHAKDAYATLLHLDSLYVLGPEAPLVWKGGTAIQSLLPPAAQRISVDLDFNSTTANVEIIREAVEDQNATLIQAGRVITIGSIPFGLFYEARYRPEHHTIEFRRVLPTLFDERVELAAGTFEDQEDDIRIQGRLSRVQVNLGHHALPALHPSKASIAFFTQPRLQPAHAVVVERASMHDLAADKILATTRHDGFGRERFKDLYDLVALRHLGAVDLGAVRAKLEAIAGRENARRYVEGSIETFRILGVERAAAQGFAASVCSQGKAWVARWEDELEATIDWLLPLSR